MHSKRTTLFTLLLIGTVSLFSPSCHARTANNCTFSPHSYDRRTAAQPLSAEQRQIDAAYVEFMKTTARFYAQHDASGVDTCCNQAKEDVIGFQFCALVRYLLSDRKKSADFLAAMPETEAQREAFWFMELISSGGTTATPTRLPGIPMPDGLLFKFVDEIFGLMKKGNPSAAEKYLFLLDDANGEFGEYMDDQMAKLVLGYPHQVLTLWPILQKHRKRLEMLQGFTTSRRLAAKYDGLCKPPDNRCVEIKQFFAPR